MAHFEAAELNQRYCSRRCSNRAARARQRRVAQVDRDDYFAQATAPGPLCPNPQKESYRSMNLAWDFIAQHHPNNPLIVPYPCSCGAFHIGNNRPRARRAAH